MRKPPVPGVDGLRNQVFDIEKDLSYVKSTPGVIAKLEAEKAMVQSEIEYALKRASGLQ